MLIPVRGISIVEHAGTKENRYPVVLGNDEELCRFLATLEGKPVGRVVDMAVKHRIAIEIGSGFRLPRLAFLKQAKAAGVKFAFGSNGRYPKIGLLDYALKTARELGLTEGDLFAPASDGQKAAQRRTG